MIRAASRFAQLRGNGGRQGSAGAQGMDEGELAVDHEPDRMPRRHEDGHGLAHCPANSEEDGGQKPVSCGGEEDLVNDLPAGGPQGLRRLAERVRDGLERILANGDDDGDAHEAEDEASIQYIDPDGGAAVGADQVIEERDPDEAPDHRGDRGQELDHDLQGLLGPPGAKLAQENGRSNAKGDRDAHGEERHRDGSRDQGQRAIGWSRCKARPPLDAGEELLQVEAVVEEIGALAVHEEKDAEDKQDRAHPAEPDKELYALFPPNAPIHG